MTEQEKLISKIQQMPENLDKGLTGKRREVFQAVQEGDVRV